MSKIKSIYEIISDKENNVPVTTTPYIKHGNKWLDEVVEKIESVTNDISSNYVNPDSFNGSDTDKIKSAISVVSQSGGTIIINRKYNITENLVIDNETDVNQEFITFMGLGMSPILNLNGYSFVGVTTNTSNGGLKFINVTLEGTEDCFKLDANLIRIFASNCVFKKFKRVFGGIGEMAQSKTYIQTVYASNCYFWSISDTVMDVPGHAFDIHFVNCVCERSKQFYRHNTVDVTSTNSFSIDFVNCNIEGCTERAIVLGTVNGANINGCYFENQNDVIDIGLSRLSHGINITNNICFPKNQSAFIILPPRSTYIIGTITNNTVRGNNGYLFGVYDDGGSGRTLNIDIYNNNFVLGEYKPNGRTVSIKNERVTFSDVVSKYYREVAGGSTVTLDINVNAGTGGRTMLVIESSHWSDGNSTESRISMIRCGYSGNNFAVTEISKSTPSGTPHLGEFSVDSNGYLVYTAAKAYTKLLFISSDFNH